MYKHVDPYISIWTSLTNKSDQKLIHLEIKISSLKMGKMAPETMEFLKISWGACPQTPLAATPLRCVAVGVIVLNNWKMAGPL